jgi:hypothetical protein
LLIHDGKNNPKAKKRSTVLCELLGSPALPAIASVTVRNSWEHLDERLDDLLPSMKSGAISIIHVAAQDRAPSPVALKRLDPRTLTIYVMDDGVALRPATSEIALIHASLPAAQQRLTEEIIRSWI